MSALVGADTLASRGGRMLDSGAIVTAHGQNDVAWRRRLYEAKGLDAERLLRIERAWADAWKPTARRASEAAS